MTFLGLRPPPEAPGGRGRGDGLCWEPKSTPNQKKNFDRGKSSQQSVDVSPLFVVDERPVDDSPRFGPKFWENEQLVMLILQSHFFHQISERKMAIILLGRRRLQLNFSKSICPITDLCKKYT